MSGNERDVLIGKLTQQYSALKISTNLAKARLGEVGKTLAIVGERLSIGAFDNARTALSGISEQEFGPGKTARPAR